MTRDGTHDKLRIVSKQELYAPGRDERFVLPGLKEKEKVRVIEYPAASNKQLVIYTDGSSHILSKPYVENRSYLSESDRGRIFGACAMIAYDKKGATVDEFTAAKEGWKTGVTELLALIMALRYVKKESKTACICCDSLYVIHAVHSWLPAWKVNDFNNNEVLYRPMWEQVSHLMYEIKAMFPRTMQPIDIVHVKGHHLDARNHEVDDLATSAMRKKRDELLNQ